MSAAISSSSNHPNRGMKKIARYASSSEARSLKKNALVLTMMKNLQLQYFLSIMRFVAHGIMICLKLKKTTKRRGKNTITLISRVRTRWSTAAHRIFRKVSCLLGKVQRNRLVIQRASSLSTEVSTQKSKRNLQPRRKRGKQCYVYRSKSSVEFSFHFDFMKYLRKLQPFENLPSAFRPREKLRTNENQYKISLHKSKDFRMNSLFD